MDSPNHIENAKRLGQTETGDAVVDRRDRLNEGDTIRVRLRRFDPTRDEAPYFEDFQVPWSRLMRVLDVLNHIVEDQEEDLGHRWYCGTKKCGTCAVRVNGREVLACWEPAAPVMEIEPLRHVRGPPRPRRRPEPRTKRRSHACGPGFTAASPTPASLNTCPIRTWNGPPGPSTV